MERGRGGGLKECEEKRRVTQMSVSMPVPIGIFACVIY